MAAYLLRLFAATVAAAILALVGLLAALRAAAPAGENPVEFANLALAAGVAEQAHLLIVAVAGLGAILAGGGLLLLAAICTAAVRTRWRSRSPQPGPIPATTTGGEKRR